MYAILSIVYRNNMMLSTLINLILFMFDDRPLCLKMFRVGDE